MNHGLRLVSPEEFARAAALEKWLAGYTTASGRRSMESSLRCVVRACLEIDRDVAVDLTVFPWEMLADLTFFDEVMRCVQARYGDKATPKYVIAMRALLRSLARDELVNYDKAQKTLFETKQHQVESDPLPLTFTSEDLWNILRRCRHDSNPVKGRRDLALISLAASTGARRAELARVELADLDRRRRTLKLLVKGGGERIASVHSASIEHVEHWLTLRGDDTGPLFPTLRKGGRIGTDPMSDHQYWKVLRERSLEADVDPTISPHDLRRWYVTTLLESGVDVFQVSRSVGHKRVQTTIRYDRRSQDWLRAVVDGLNLPGLADLELPEEEDDAPPFGA